MFNVYLPPKKRKRRHFSDIRFGLKNFFLIGSLGKSVVDVIFLKCPNTINVALKMNFLIHY